MSEQEILEGNKLIAEFVGTSYTSTFSGKGKITLYCKPGYKIANCEAHELEYHSSWDWLMPVVEKITTIEDSRFSVEISSVGIWACFIKRDDVFEQNIADFGGYEPMILNAYHSVVKFVKWYNQNKQ